MHSQVPLLGGQEGLRTDDCEREEGREDRSIVPVQREPVLTLFR